MDTVAVARGASTHSVPRTREAARATRRARGRLALYGAHQSYPWERAHAEAILLVPVAAERDLRAPKLSSATRPARRGAAVCARGLPPSDAPPGARHPARRSAGAHPGPPSAPWTP